MQGPIIGTVLLAGVTPAGEPKYLNGTYLVAGLDADGQPHPISVGSDGQLAGVGTTIKFHRVSRTAGDLPTSTGATLVEVSSTLRATVEAEVGDLLVCHVDTYIQPGNRSIRGDLATIVGGAIVNRFNAGANGSGGFYTILVSSNGNQANAKFITETKVVVEGDISGGQVTVSPVACNESAGGTAGSMAANTDFATVVTLINMGH